ncbi:hypothetical protein [Calothrix rhizosoleniae]|uniref:hypothetical protein n=1 Tax=Calothrix rhizosoleniae TaxID=888997 RepID=UPI001356567F|nr:hypothetical protein [Calothrix rhizosoleniae]
MGKKLWQKLDDKQAQVIVGGTNKGELVDSVAEKSQITGVKMESLTIYGLI